MRVNKNVPQRERRRMVIDNFKGVDFSSPPLACSPTRSPDAVNFIGDHGINRKRHGWEQVMDKFDGNINGIHQVDEKTLLVYAQTSFFKVEKGVDGLWRKSKLGVYSDVYPEFRIAGVLNPIDGIDNINEPSLLNKRCYFFTYGGDTYVVGCGMLLKYGDIDTESGNSTKGMIAVNPYVPTTTIDINPNSKDVRGALDPVNLLTPLRRNKLVGNKSGAWKLDSPVDLSDFALVDNCVPIHLFNILVEKPEGVLERYGVRKMEHNYADGGKLIYYGIVEYQQPSNVDGNGVFGTEELGSVHTVYYNGNKKTTIEFNFDTTPAVAGDNNITVTFCPLGVSNLIDGTFQNKIVYTFDKAFVSGINFGDRLFVSANNSSSDLYNDTICFSEHDNFTYFPDLFTIRVGTHKNPIMAAFQIGNSSICAITEDGNGIVAEGTYRTEYDGNGNIKKVIPVFTRKLYTFEKPASGFACLNFNGDSLFLSKNGIYGIEPQQNIAADIRAARDRGQNISSRISSIKNLTNASAIVHGDRCYFAVDVGTVGGVFVTEAASKYVPEGALSYNYEWWYIKNVNARTWAIVNGELWFGTLGGNIYRFTDGYIDSYWNETGSGDIAFSKNNEELNKSDNDLGDNEKIFYAKDAGSLRNGRRVQFMTTAASGDKDLTGKNLYMCNVDKENKTFQLSYYNRGDDVLTTDDPDLVGPITCTFDNTYSSIRMRFYQDTPVKASWSTPPLDLGNDAVAKTMHSMTVTAESGTGAKFKFGYETRNGFMERNAEGTGKFDLNNIDFNDFSFENGFQNSFTVKTHARDFNYIRFHILSEEAAPCAVHRIGAEYKYTHKNRGVK